MKDILTVGDCYVEPIRYTQAQVDAFAEVTGDKNPLHLDAEFAQESVFGRRIIHGMLSSTVFSKVFGMDFPGPGTIYMNQYLDFRRPMFVNIDYEAVFEIVECMEGKHRARIKTQIKEKENGKVTVEGEAILLNKEKFK